MSEATRACPRKSPVSGNRWLMTALRPLAGPGENVERCIHGGRIRQRVAHLPDDDFEGPERGDNVSLGDGPHRPPTPHLPGHLALSTGDHDAMLIEELRQHRLVVEAVRRQDPRDGNRMHAVT